MDEKTTKKIESHILNGEAFSFLERRRGVKSIISLSGYANAQYEHVKSKIRISALVDFSLLDSSELSWCTSNQDRLLDTFFTFLNQFEKLDDLREFCEKTFFRCR